MIARIREWFRVRLWEDDLNDVSRWKALGIGALRVTIHAARSFSRNLVGVQAAGLTMLSLSAPRFFLRMWYKAWATSVF